MFICHTYARIRDRVLALTLLTHCDLVTPYGDMFVSRIGLLPNGTKRLPEPMLIYR